MDDPLARHLGRSPVVGALSRGYHAGTRGDCGWCVADALNDEERDGPRYVLAIRGARLMREREARYMQFVTSGVGYEARAWSSERALGIPDVWWNR